MGDMHKKLITIFCAIYCDNDKNDNKNNTIQHPYFWLTKTDQIGYKTMPNMCKQCNRASKQ